MNRPSSAPLGRHIQHYIKATLEQPYRSISKATTLYYNASPASSTSSHTGRQSPQHISTHTDHHLTRLEHPRCILQNHAWPLSRRRSREPPHARDQIRHERLARIAAEWMGATHCTSIQKYPDGMFNKAFLMSMDNGREVVAKVPNPNSGIPHLTTAREVATMNFVYPTTSINAGSS